VTTSWVTCRTRARPSGQTISTSTSPPRPGASGRSGLKHATCRLEHHPCSSEWLSRTPLSPHPRPSAPSERPLTLLPSSFTARLQYATLLKPLPRTQPEVTRWPAVHCRQPSRLASRTPTAWRGARRSRPADLASPSRGPAQQHTRASKRDPDASRRPRIRRRPARHPAATRVRDTRSSRTTGHHRRPRRRDRPTLPPRGGGVTATLPAAAVLPTAALRSPLARRR
jgi:hypothetical protein